MLSKMESGLVVLAGAFIVVLLLAAGAGAAEEDPAPQAEHPFYLDSGDIVEVSVWRDETLNREVLVRPDGNISFPLIGEVRARGLSVEELRQAIQEKIIEFIPDTTVTVMLVQLGSPRIYVLGKVNKPGMYIMQGRTTVVQALALAGGVTPFAGERSIRIIRVRGDKQVEIPFNYVKLRHGDDLEQNIFLEPGDTIIVP